MGSKSENESLRQVVMNEVKGIVDLCEGEAIHEAMDRAEKIYECLSQVLKLESHPSQLWL